MPQPTLSDINIFRAGRQTSSAGTVIDFTDDVLRDAAAAYDPALSEAPIVVGHPAVDAPAYGWIAALTYGENGLNAHPQQIDPEFADMVRAGRFKKVSASFYLPDSPTNPAPGSLYLRHVGFLGAQPPAVKGLKQAAFAAGEAGIVEVEFAESADDALWNRFVGWLTARMDRSERAAFAEGLSSKPWNGDASQYPSADAYCEACLVDQNASGQPKTKAQCHLPVKEAGGALNRHALFMAEGALSSARAGVKLPVEVKRAAAKKLVALLKAHGLTPTASLSKLAEFSESATTEITTVDKNTEQREADFAEREKALQEREQVIKNAETLKRDHDNAEFVESLVKAGKVLPRDQAGLAAFLTTFQPQSIVAFAEGDAKVEKTADEWFRAFLTHLPKAIDYAELAAGGDASDGSAHFAAAQGTTVSAEGMSLFNRAKAYQIAHPNTAWLDAVRAAGG